MPVLSVTSHDLLTPIQSVFYAVLQLMSVMFQLMFSMIDLALGLAVS